MGPGDVIAQEQLANDKLEVPDTVKPHRACVPVEIDSNVGVSLFSLP